MKMLSNWWKWTPLCKKIWCPHSWYDLTILHQPYDSFIDGTSPSWSPAVRVPPLLHANYSTQQANQLVDPQGLNHIHLQKVPDETADCAELQIGLHPITSFRALLAQRAKIRLLGIYSWHPPGRLYMLYKSSIQVLQQQRSRQQTIKKPYPAISNITSECRE